MKMNHFSLRGKVRLLSVIAVVRARKMVSTMTRDGPVV